MSKVRLYGSTSGFVELAAPAISDDGVLVLPTAAQGFGPAGIGSNVVQTVKTDTFSTTSTTFTAVTGLSVAITPTSDTSKILVTATITGAADQTQAYFNMLRNAVTLTVGDAEGGRIQCAGVFGIAGNVDSTLTTIISLLDSPATTAAVTYSVHTRNAGSNNVRVNRSIQDGNSQQSGRSISTITAIEVAA